MKTKFIVISLGAILTVAIIFIVSKQTPLEAPEKEETKISQEPSKVPSQVTSSKIEIKKEVTASEKVSPLGKMPDPSDKAAMEAFFNKAFIAWNDKVASLIVNELNLGQDSLDKYSAIRDDFYQSQFSLFQVQTSIEPKGTENKEGQRRLASAINKTKEILERDHGIDLDKDELSKEDQAKVQDAIQEAMNTDSANFKDDHLKKVKKLLGDEGYQKYDKMKNDFNKEITEEGEEPLFKI